MSRLIDFLNINKTKLEHSKVLVNKVLRQPVNNASLDYKNDDVIFTPISWAQPSVLFECVKQHLRDHNYRNVCENYNHGKEYTNRVHADMDKKVRQYRETITSKLKDAKLNLLIRKNEYTIKPGEYSEKRINHLIFYDVIEKNRTGTSAKRLEIVPVALPSQPTREDMYFLEWFDVGGDIVAMGDFASVKYLKNVIENIEDDKEFENMILEINSLKTKIKYNTPFEHFILGINNIIKQVEYENKPLYGECNDPDCD